MISISVLRDGTPNITIEFDTTTNTMRILDRQKNSGYLVYDIGTVISESQISRLDGGSAENTGGQFTPVDGGRALVVEF
jgi:hypothetical protein